MKVFVWSGSNHKMNPNKFGSKILSIVDPTMNSKTFNNYCSEIHFYQSDCTAQLTGYFDIQFHITIALYH